MVLKKIIYSTIIVPHGNMNFFSSCFTLIFLSEREMETSKQEMNKKNTANAPIYAFRTGVANPAFYHKSSQHQSFKVFSITKGALKVLEEDLSLECMSCFYFSLPWGFAFTAKSIYSTGRFKLHWHFLLWGPARSVWFLSQLLSSPASSSSLANWGLKHSAFHSPVPPQLWKQWHRRVLLSLLLFHFFWKFVRL